MNRLCILHRKYNNDLPELLYLLDKYPSIQPQFLKFVEKSILYAKITVSQQNFVSKLSFKNYQCLLFS